MFNCISIEDFKPILQGNQALSLNNIWRKQSTVSPYTNSL